MSSDEYRPAKEISRIFKLFKDFLQIRYDIFKLEITENLVKILSGFYVFFVLVSLITTSALFFSFAAAYYFGEIFDSLPLGFSLVGLFYLFMILIFVLLKNRIITRPIIKFVSKIFFNKKAD